MKNVPELLVSIESRGEAVSLPAIDAKPVKLEIMPDGSFFIAKAYYYGEPTDLWQVFELITGKPVGDCAKTRKKAVELANDCIQRNTGGYYEAFALALNHWPKINN